MMHDTYSAKKDPRNTGTIGLVACTALVATNMIGTGVFTSLGFQLNGIESPLAIMLLWLIGGVIALCGAMVYGELGVVFPRSGGEYNFLSRIYHPLAGFLAGWLSATVGFTAPLALSAKAFGAYLARVLPEIDPTLTACMCIVFFAFVHASGVRHGSFVQNLVTAISIGLVLVPVIAAFTYVSPQPLNWAPNARFFSDVGSASFAVSLVFVSYSYSGWNAATYVAAEIRKPKINLPASLLIGTTVVTIVYVMLNITFLRTAPVGEMKGVIEVAYVSAAHIFGNLGGKIMSLVICATLLGSVSGMTLAGARIPLAIAEDHLPDRLQGYVRQSNALPLAITFQTVITLVLVLTGSFAAILAFIGFTLSLSTCLTVAGIFIIRARKPYEKAAYRCWGYPVTPVIFLILNFWMLVFIFSERPLASSLGLLMIGSGVPVFFWLGRNKQRVGERRNLTPIELLTPSILPSLTPRSELIAQPCEASSITTVRTGNRKETQ